MDLLELGSRWGLHFSETSVKARQTAINNVEIITTVINLEKKNYIKTGLQ